MPEPVNLDFIAAQLRLVLDEQRAMRNEQRRVADALAGLSRSIDQIRDGLTVAV